MERTRKGNLTEPLALCVMIRLVLSCAVWSGFTGELLAERQFGQVGDRVGRGAGGSQAAIPLSRGAHSGKHRAPVYDIINSNSMSLLRCRSISLGTRSCCYFVVPACVTLRYCGTACALPPNGMQDQSKMPSNGVVDAWATLYVVLHMVLQRYRIPIGGRALFSKQGPPYNRERVLVLLALSRCCRGELKGDRGDGIM